MKLYSSIFLFLLIGKSLVAQDPNTYGRISFANDSTGKYEIIMHQYSTKNNLTAKVKEGTAIKFTDLQKLNFIETPNYNLSNKGLMPYDGERKYYSFSKFGWSFKDIFVAEVKELKKTFIEDKDRFTGKKMYIIIPVLTKVVYNQFFIENILFEPNKYLTITQAAKYDVEDFTGKIILDGKVEKLALPNCLFNLKLKK